MKMDFKSFGQYVKNIEKKHRPIPFRFWDERLDCEETRRQVRIMDEAGVGGYFMHARGGLLTDYMGDEWFDNVRAAIDDGICLVHFGLDTRGGRDD